MIKNIKKALKKRNIKKYRIVKHTINISTNNVENDIHENKKIQKRIYVVLFEIDDKLGKLSFTECDINIFNSILLNYLDEGIFYCKGKLTNNNNYKLCAEETVIKQDTNFYNNSYIDEVYDLKKESKFAYVNFKQTYIYHSIEIFDHELYNNDIINLVIKEANLIDDKNIFYSIFDIKKATFERKLVDLFIEEKKYPHISSASKVKFEQINGHVLIKPLVIKNIFSSFIKCLQSDLIKSSNSFIKISDLNKCVLNKSISIYDEPNYDITLHYDYEGSEVVKKTLIKNGILTNFLSDLESMELDASQHGGNRFLDYSSGNDYIQPSNIFVLFKNQIKSIKDVNIQYHITGFLNNMMQFDTESGIIDCILIGNNTYDFNIRYFHLKMHIIDLINSIEYTFHNYKYVGNYKISEMIFNLKIEY